MRTDDMQKQLDTITRRYNELSESYHSSIKTIQENQSTYDRQQAKLLARFDAIEKEKNK